MKKLASTLFLTAAAMVLAGCSHGNEFGSTPAMSTSEREWQIVRNWDYEGKQISDDTDHILLLRPAGRLTLWNVQ